MAAFIILVVCYGILVYSLEFQDYIHIYIYGYQLYQLPQSLCNIYSKQGKIVETIIFLTVFCLFIFCSYCMCIHFNRKKLFIRHMESLECLKFDDISIEICLETIRR